MKRIVISVFALAFCAGITNVALATVPDLIPVQGVLADDMGDPVDGPTDITFTLYDDDAGTTTLWTDGFSDVDVVDGFFTVYLGSDTALDFASLISNSEIWLGIEVETDGEMDLIQLAAVPFAIEAGTCQSVGSLTESDINSNFLPSTYAPAWADITGLPAGFDDDTDDVDDTVDYTEISGIVGTAASTVAAGNHNHDAAYAPISHTHAWTDITGVPADLADGDDNTNAATLCAAGQFLNGDGTCDAVPVDTNTNAGTICAAGQFLNGDGTCDAVPNGIVDMFSTWDWSSDLDTTTGTNVFVPAGSITVPAGSTYEATCVTSANVRPATNGTEFGVGCAYRIGTGTPTVINAFSGTVPKISLSSTAAQYSTSHNGTVVLAGGTTYSLGLVGYTSATVSLSLYSNSGIYANSWVIREQ